MISERTLSLLAPGFIGTILFTWGLYDYTAPGSINPQGDLDLGIAYLYMGWFLGLLAWVFYPTREVEEEEPPSPEHRVKDSTK